MHSIILNSRINVKDCKEMYCDLLITLIALGSSVTDLFQMIELNNLLFFICSFVIFYLFI